jgi:hypothetical protein
LAVDGRYIGSLSKIETLRVIMLVAFFIWLGKGVQKMNKNIPTIMKFSAVFVLVMVLATFAGGAAQQVEAAPTSVTLVGDLQSELGCTGGDWDPTCADTHLVEQGYGVWRGEFAVPAGNWQYKMALNDAWDVG